LDRLREIVERFAGSVWASQAAELLERLGPKRVDIARN
jgi:hypothetical protein